MAGEHGPYESERDAAATKAAAKLRAAFDAAPGRGAGDLGRLALLTGTCKAAGVELGTWDEDTLRWLSRWEDATVISVAGMIHRAHEAAAIDLIVQAATDGRDFAGWLAGLLAEAANHLGGVDALLASRPGGWEGDLIRLLVDGTIANAEEEGDDG